MSQPPLGSTLNLFGLSIPWYSLLIMTAIAIGIVLATREEKRLEMPGETILNFALLAIPLALIGARIYYVIFTWNRFANDPLEILRIWNGGLAIYGGILGALLAAFLLTRKGNVSFFTLLDVCAPSLALGQAIGRWGNYANMEAYGARIYNEAAQFFPNAVQIPIIGADGTVFWYWHMATFFYESIWCAIIFAILWSKRKKMGRPGDVFFWYTLLYCAGRTVIEGLRDDSLMINVSAAQVRFSQVFSAIACIAIIVVFSRRLIKRRKLHLPDYLCWGAAALGIACTFVGEFERNAYQMLFIPAQLLLGALLAVDLVLFIYYISRTKRFNAPSIWMVVMIFLCALTLLLGIGRLGATNTAYVALRQSVAMAHVVLAGAWLYLRCGKPRKVTKEAKADATAA